MSIFGKVFGLNGRKVPATGLNGYDPSRQYRRTKKARKAAKASRRANR